MFKTLPFGFNVPNYAITKQKDNICKLIEEKKERGTGKNKRTIEKHPADNLRSSVEL